MKNKIIDHVEFIYKIVRGFVSDPESAKDLSQQVVLKVLQKEVQFDGRSKYETWIYRIAVNTAIDFYRKPKIGDVEWYERKNTDEDLKNDIREAMLRLPDEKRDVLVLYFFIGYPLNEIAERLGLALGTVLSRYQRAKEELKGILKETGYDYETQ